MFATSCTAKKEQAHANNIQQQIAIYHCWRRQVSYKAIREACIYIFILSRGTSITLKLSPNLRLPCKAPKKQQWLDQLTLQVMKLDRLLSLVRELPEGGETIQDAATEVASQ